MLTRERIGVPWVVPVLTPQVSRNPAELDVDIRPDADPASVARVLISHW
jgi:hypothetical protein